MPDYKKEMLKDLNARLEDRGVGPLRDAFTIESALKLMEDGVLDVKHEPELRRLVGIGAGGNFATYNFLKDAKAPVMSGDLKIFGPKDTKIAPVIETLIEMAKEETGKLEAVVKEKSAEDPFKTPEQKKYSDKVELDNYHQQYDRVIPLLEAVRRNSGKFEKESDFTDAQKNALEEIFQRVNKTAGMLPPSLFTEGTQKTRDDIRSHESMVKLTINLQPYHRARSAYDVNQNQQLDKDELPKLMVAARSGELKMTDMDFNRDLSIGARDLAPGMSVAIEAALAQQPEAREFLNHYRVELAPSEEKAYQIPAPPKTPLKANGR